MARTKITPRKRTGRCRPEPLPQNIIWEYQEPRKEMVDGLRLQMPRLLWQLLQDLGYQVHPMYLGTCNPLGDRDYTWHVVVTIFKPRRTTRGGQEYLREHQSVGHWRTFDDAIQDAARQAWMVLMSMERNHFERTHFAHLPQRRSSTLQAAVTQVPRTADRTLHTTVSALYSVSRRLDVTEDELAYMHDRFDDLRRRHEELKREAFRDGVGPEDGEEELEYNFRPQPRIRSPSRKRIRREMCNTPSFRAVADWSENESEMEDSEYEEEEEAPEGEASEGEFEEEEPEEEAPEEEAPEEEEPEEEDPEEVEEAEDDENQVKDIYEDRPRENGIVWD